MDISSIKHLANQLSTEVGFLTQINSDKEYQLALELVEALTDDYSDVYAPLLLILADTIEQWETKIPEIAEYIERVNAMPKGAAMPRTLMQQYGLFAEDLRLELGSPSTVSMLLSGKRNFTINHIQALCRRFNLRPDHFID